MIYQLILRREPFIDLPPCNSFCRMLTHKLADYYHMTHQVDALAGAVRIFRTPFCRLPPSLTSISNPPTSGNTPPPTQPAMKIMRRGGEGDTGPNASKAASETGSDGKDKSLSAKEKYEVVHKLLVISILRQLGFRARRERLHISKHASGSSGKTRTSPIRLLANLVGPYISNLRSRIMC